MKPFRWDLSRVEQLGSLVDPDEPRPEPEWVAQISHAAAQIVARGNNADLVFVGRSPENFFDYLSGVFATTDYESRIHHLNISNRFKSLVDIRRDSPDAYAALRQHHVELGLDPAAIVKSRTGICFVDLVASGSTFGQLTEFLIDWATEIGIVESQLVDKIHFVGITQRTKTSPNTWRWQQHASWVERHNIKQIKNVSISSRLWDQLGNRQPKVTPGNPPQEWADDSALAPVRRGQTKVALQLAYHLYCIGTEQREAFGRALASSEAAKYPWARRLMADLRPSG